MPPVRLHGSHEQQYRAVCAHPRFSEEDITAVLATRNDDLLEALMLHPSLSGAERSELLARVFRETSALSQSMVLAWLRSPDSEASDLALSVLDGLPGNLVRKAVEIMRRRLELGDSPRRARSMALYAISNDRAGYLPVSTTTAIRFGNYPDITADRILAAWAELPDATLWLSAIGENTTLFADSRVRGVIRAMAKPIPSLIFVCMATAQDPDDCIRWTDIAIARLGPMATARWVVDDTATPRCSDAIRELAGRSLLEEVACTGDAEERTWAILQAGLLPDSSPVEPTPNGPNAQPQRNPATRPAAP